MYRRAALAAACLALAAGLAVPAASGSRNLLVGLYDDAQALYGNPDGTFPVLKQLHVKVLRVTLYWGGSLGVARQRPRHADDPADRAYSWALYDRTVNYAAQYGISVLFSIWGTPGWANGGAGLNRAPTRASDLEAFAYAAATRYSGAFVARDGRTLPAVHLWLAWNEPNNPTFLVPQWRRVRGAWTIQSAVDYARICNAVYAGVHGTFLAGERVGCGVTAPRGNNSPTSSRPSVSPLAFLRAAKKAGLRTFDAWAHHPYYGSRGQEPDKQPPLGPRGNPATAVTLGNIDALVAEVTRLYGRKPIWITEYGYQTNPPDRVFGVTWRQQATYLTQSFAIARANPRIDLMVWFLLRDESSLSRWQSGLETGAGQKKPSFDAYARLTPATKLAARRPRGRR